MINYEQGRRISQDCIEVGNDYNAFSSPKNDYNLNDEYASNLLGGKSPGK